MMRKTTIKLSNNGKELILTIQPEDGFQTEIILDQTSALRFFMMFAANMDQITRKNGPGEQEPGVEQKIEPLPQVKVTFEDFMKDVNKTISLATNDTKKDS